MVAERPGQPPPPPVTVLALVDSGAWTSIFPKQIAYDLGITDAELQLDPNPGQGVGSSFPIWTTSLAIRAGIAFHTPNPDGSERGWGPGFILKPAFTEHSNFLLGRADFFASFAITFETDLATGSPVFHLDAPDPVIPPAPGS